MGVLRRRVLRCKGSDVVGVEDDLMVPEAPEDLVVVGDGALMAALTRTRGARMRDIVATIQRHQDEAIRAPARGVTEITGGPGTGKTVVALHRAAYLLYSDRRRFEAGGILVVGPSSAYTAYIERVLPSLGEETVTLRSLGDVVDGVTTARLDPPAAAAIKGSLRIRRVLGRAARDLAPDAPTQLRVFVAGPGDPARVDALDRVRNQVLRSHQRNSAADAALQALAEMAWPPSARATAPSSWTVPRPRGRRGVHGAVVAPPRRAGGAAVAGRPRPPVPLRHRGALPRGGGASSPPRCRPRSTPARGPWPTSRSSDFHGGIYGLAAPGDGIKVGFHGTGPEVDPDGRDFRSEPGRLADLRAYARRWLPGVDADDFTEISCTYTTTLDSDFILDRRGPLVVAAGFSGHGFKHAPAVGELLADLATTDRPADPHFALGRAYREGEQ